MTDRIDELTAEYSQLLLEQLAEGHRAGRGILDRLLRGESSTEAGPIVLEQAFGINIVPDVRCPPTTVLLTKRIVKLQDLEPSDVLGMITNLFNPGGCTNARKRSDGRPDATLSLGHGRGEDGPARRDRGRASAAPG